MSRTQTVIRNNANRKLTGLYAITDQQLITENRFTAAIESALLGGASIIQYRDKSANQQKRLQQATIVCSLCQQYQAISIINDDIELAKAVNADGVHLGKDDHALIAARQQLGDNAIIGISCYNDISLARKAETNSADYVAFGAIFSSPSKPEAIVSGLDIIKQARQQLSIPICTIGGITQHNIQSVIQHGADMTAIISGLFSAEDIEQTARKLTQHFA